MDYRKILSHVDHTLLKQGSTVEQIEALCDEGLKFQTASICIPPSYVSMASKYLNGKLPVCTVIGFPNGYTDIRVKYYETEIAVADGADEIDMVINIGMLKNKNYSAILSEINEIKKACDGRLLKVIIETCLLTNEEKIMMCKIISESDAEYIKTSTGFSTAGATFDDIKLFAKHTTNGTKIKAAGGIKSFDDAKKFLELGASRLGTSRLVEIMKINC